MRQPLHVQVEEQIAAWLRRLQPGDRLPSEPDFAAELGVSRTTLRQALARIERAGLVERRPGAGTVVTRPMLDQPFGGAVTLRQAASAAGIELTPVLEGVSLIPVSEGPAELADATDRLLWLRRKFHHHDRPAAREELWLADPEVARLSELIALDPTASVYEFLALTGHRPEWSEEVLRADMPASEERELFGRSPILRLRRVSGGAVATEVREMALRSDLVRMSARWGRKDDPAQSPAKL